MRERMTWTWIALEVVALILALAGIALALTRPEMPVLGNLSLYHGAAVAGLIVAVGILYDRVVARMRLGADIELAQAALAQQIRQMENYPTKSSSRRGRGRIEVVERFASKAAELGRPLAMGGEATPDLSTLGLEVIERNEKDGSGHWRRVNGIRRGAACFRHLFVDRNPTAAFMALTEHLRVQARLENGATADLTELKMLFGLPIEWPERGLAERLEREGLHWRRARELLALADHREVVFAGVRYIPFPDRDSDPAMTYSTPDAILEQFRWYIR